jgi:hypothetical protein
MDAKQQEIINSLDEKAPRSCLGPYRELIFELRRRNRTYREILLILANRCELHVSISTLHDFLRAQQRKASQLKKKQTKEQDSPVLNETPQPQIGIIEDILDMKNVQQRIAALKQRTTPTRTNAPSFSYDPSQPLHLPSKTEKSGDEE